MKLIISMLMAITFAILSGEALAHGPRAVIINYCPWTVYLWAVTEDYNPPSHVPDAELEQGGRYIQDWHQPSKGCPSYKLANYPHLDHPTRGYQTPISQFEVCRTDTQWYYDFSNVDCMNPDPAKCPFAYHGVLVRTINPECPTARCVLGDLYCSGAYLYSTDDTKTHGCDYSTGDAIVELCDEFAP